MSASPETPAYPKKVNLGCGFKKRPGFLNVDLNAFHEPDLVGDVARLPEFPDGYFEYALAEDVLEHIPRPKTRNVLREWNRILKLGGTLELQIPNVVGLLKLLESRKFKSVEAQEWLLQCLFGTQAYEGDFHYTGFTEITLRAVLSEEGFKVTSLKSQDHWLFRVRAEKVAEARRDPIYDLPEAEFVTEAYRRLLGRDPDPEGFNHYVHGIQTGTMLREALLDTLEKSEEARQFRARRHP
jgi:SAM-dependent methyltransferase